MAAEVVVDKPETLAALLAGRVEDTARGCLARGGLFALALPGGSVATTFFPRLAAAPVDWSRADFFWGDERAVPPAHPDSNYAAAWTLWLEAAKVPPGRIHRMEAEAGDASGAAAAYADLMVRLLGSPPRLDIALLGVGPDGHVCSLFPRHPLLGEQTRWVAALDDSPKPPPRRLTLTLPTLEAAELVVVAALGESKAAPIRAALEEPRSQLPVALVTRRSRRVLFLLDEPAASLLGRGR